MPWEQVRCFECGTTYGEQWVKQFYQTYGELMYCPRCGCDYLLGYADRNDSITIR